MNDNEPSEVSMANPDILQEFVRDIETHPIPEMFLLREAISKGLMNDQRKIWEMYAYDKMTLAAIAKKMKVTPQTISKRIKAIERAIIKWCNNHKELYQTMKEAEEIESDNNGC